MQKILITGIAGFIGSKLARRLLNSKFKVIGIDDLSKGAKENIPEGVEFHQLDIRSQDIYPIFYGAEYVFHLAARSCMDDCRKDPVGTIDINVGGTANVFEAAKRAGVKKVIYASSAAIYEGNLAYFPTPELAPVSNICIAPQTFYAVSKAISEQLIEPYRRLSNMRFTILRYFNVYGPRQDYRRGMPQVMCAFISKLLKNKRPIIYGTGEKRRDFIYIDDLNDFHLLCISDPRTDGKTFNMGSGENYSINEIYALIGDLLDSKLIPRIPVSPVYEPDLPEEAQITLADITRAKKLGWKPKTDIKEGLRKEIEWMRECL